MRTRKSNAAIGDPAGCSLFTGTYADADLAGDIGSRKSTAGFCMVLNGGEISQGSKLQAAVALPAAEAVAIAGTEAAKYAMRMFLGQRRCHRPGTSQQAIEA